jgi:ricin-type beta-trefoil lectin protein
VAATRSDNRAKRTQQRRARRRRIVALALMTATTMVGAVEAATAPAAYAQDCTVNTSTGQVSCGGMGTVTVVAPPDPPIPPIELPPIDPPPQPPPGGGGDPGGGDPSAPGNPQTPPPEQNARVAQTGRARALALEALQRPDCANFLDGGLTDQANTGGRDAYNMLLNAPIQVMTSNAADGRMAQSPHATTPNGLPPGELIQLFPNAFDPAQLAGQYAAWQNLGYINAPGDLGAQLSADEYLAFTILHELGHQTGVIPSPHPETGGMLELMYAFEYEVMVKCFRPGAGSQSLRQLSTVASTVAVEVDPADDSRSPLLSAYECARSCPDFPVDSRVWSDAEAPAVVTSPSGRSDAFTMGDDRAVWHSFQAGPGAPWSAWTSLGGWVWPRIVTAVNTDGRVVVFATGSDDRLYFNQQQSAGGGFGGWQRHSDRVIDHWSLAVARNPDGRLEVWADSWDNPFFPYPYHTWQTSPGGGWSGWAQFGDVPISAGARIAAVTNAAGRIEVYASLNTSGVGDTGFPLPSNGAMHRMVSTASGWSGWSPLNLTSTAGVVAVRHPDGRMHLFSNRGPTDVDHAWQTSPGSGFTGWSRLISGGCCNGMYLEGAAVNRDGRLDVLVHDEHALLLGQECPGCSGGWSSFVPIANHVAPAAPPVVNGQVYRLTARHSGRCLDVEGALTTTGAAVHQWDCHGGGNQQWRLVQQANGSYALVAQHSGKCLDVAGVSTQDGGVLHQWDCHGGANQQWWPIPAANGRYQLVSVNSQLCLAVSHDATGNGPRAIQENCGALEFDERWLLTPM